MNRSTLTIGVLVALALLTGGVRYLLHDHPEVVGLSPASDVAPVPDVHDLPSGAASPPVSPGPRAARSIVVENGMLSVSLNAQPLGPVLSEIAGKAHVNIVIVPTAETRPVTIELPAQPLEQGLRALLREWDVFFYDSAGALRSLWVYERDAGTNIVPVPPENWASTAEVMRQLNGGAPAERVSAIEAIVARNGPEAQEIVSRALFDASAEVRERALDAGLSAGVPIARETLTSLTYDGASPVRMLALEAIAAGTPINGPAEAETEDLIRRLQNDADAEVRTKATELLESRRASP